MHLSEPDCKQTIVMLKKNCHTLLFLSLLTEAFLFLVSFTPPGDYSKLDDGIIIRLRRRTENGARLLRLQAVTDKIIHVTASPVDSFTQAPSLMVVDKKRPAVKWDIKEGDETVTLYTAS